jgi:MinD-like ATPase involved in chromosome partitioning or flagellar assembly
VLPLYINLESADHPSMAALTIGVTSARFEACKRGLAANYAAVLACDEQLRVCVVDADPRSCDVGTRLGVVGPTMRRFTAPKLRGDLTRLDARKLARMAYPPLHVLPIEPAYVDLDYRAAYDAAITTVREAFDVVIVDLPVGAGRPGPTLDGRMVDRLDVVLVGLTPDRPSLAATLRHLELFAEAHERGAIAPHVSTRVVITGDEASTVLEPDDVVDQLGDAYAGHVPQLWGRALPNLGFGPTLGVAFLEAELRQVHATAASLRVDRVAAALRH